MKKWTKEEEQFLIDNYAEHGTAYCAKKLNRTVRSVGAKAQVLNVQTKFIPNRWTKEEEQFLIDNYAEHGATYCVEKLNKTTASIKNKARRLNLTKTIGWTKEQEQFLIKNYSKYGAAYCAKSIDKTVTSIWAKAFDLALTQNTNWAEKEIQFLLDNYENNGPFYCSQILNRSYSAVVNKANKFNLYHFNRYNISNILYIIYFPELGLFKVGITNSVETRIKSFGKKCIVLKAIEFTTAEEAFQKEKELLKTVKLVNTGMLNNGNTETFTLPSKEIKELLDKEYAYL
jgi:hypothetical protein